MANKKAPPTKETGKKERTSSSSGLPKLTLLMAASAVGFYFLPGNPTQRVGMLLSLMKSGLPGGENTTEFDAIYANTKSNEQQKVKYDADVANSFYNLATKFYEYGWGDSFHFGFRKRGEGHVHSIINSQRFVAQKLRVSDMDPVLDLGCGIGGPLRGVVRATGANVTGLTINEHQVARAYEITSTQTDYMKERCHYMVNDYLDIKGLEPNSFAAAFYMESSLHCQNRTKTFEQTYKLLKPGGRLVAMEYVTLPAWDETSSFHQDLMKKHLHGNGAAETPSIEGALKFVRDAGFEVEEHFDFMDVGAKLYGDDEFPWWGDLQAGPFHSTIPALLPAHPYVRNVLPYFLKPLANMGLIPEGVPRAAELMNIGGDGLSGLGKEKALTPQYFIGAVKPLI